jgi:hypothetical protein
MVKVEITKRGLVIWWIVVAVIITFAVFSFGLIDVGGSRDEEENIRLNNWVDDCWNANADTARYYYCVDIAESRKERACAEDPDYDICSDRRVELLVEMRE